MRVLRCSPPHETHGFRGDPESAARAHSDHLGTRCLGRVSGRTSKAMSSTPGTRALNLKRILDEPVDWRYKSFPPGPAVPIRAVGEQGWNVLGGPFMHPVMTLKPPPLRHNLQEMAGYCRTNGVELAPHVKTHMSPQLFQMQLDAGAWALTVANVSQARVWRAFGA